MNLAIFRHSIFLWFLIRSFPLASASGTRFWVEPPTLFSILSYVGPSVPRISNEAGELNSLRSGSIRYNVFLPSVANSDYELNEALHISQKESGIINDLLKKFNMNYPNPLTNIVKG